MTTLAHLLLVAQIINHFSRCTESREFACSKFHSASSLLPPSSSLWLFMSKMNECQSQVKCQVRESIDWFFWTLCFLPSFLFFWMDCGRCKSKWMARNGLLLVIYWPCLSAHLTHTHKWSLSHNKRHPPTYLNLLIIYKKHQEEIEVVEKKFKS
jgi:hypothetical protein